MVELTFTEMLSSLGSIPIKETVVLKDIIASFRFHINIYFDWYHNFKSNFANICFGCRFWFKKLIKRIDSVGFCCSHKNVFILVVH